MNVLNSELRLIKRYLNRKLYDTSISQYITLEELAKLIQAGANIKVIDNKSDLDITYQTLMQMLFEQDKKSNVPQNVELLMRVIRNQDGQLSSYIKFLESQLAIGHHELEERPRIQRPIWSEQTTTEVNNNATPTHISSIESQSSLN